MADPNAIIAGLRTRLETVSGLHVPNRVTAQITPPAALVTLDRVLFDAAMDGDAADTVWLVDILCAVSSEAAGQTALYAFLTGAGATSVRAALTADPTLGGAASYVEVPLAKHMGVMEVQGTGGQQYYTAEFEVRVGAAG